MTAKKHRWSCDLARRTRKKRGMTRQKGRKTMQKVPWVKPHGSRKGGYWRLDAQGELT